MKISIFHLEKDLCDVNENFYFADHLKNSPQTFLDLAPRLLKRELTGLGIFQKIK